MKTPKSNEKKPIKITKPENRKIGADASEPISKAKLTPTETAMARQALPLSLTRRIPAVPFTTRATMTMVEIV